MYKEGIDSKTLLQLNATIIAGIFIFASILSLQIVDPSKYGVSPSLIQDLNETLKVMESTPVLNTQEFQLLSTLLQNLTNRSVLTFINENATYIDKLTQENIDLYESLIKNYQLLDEI